MASLIPRLTNVVTGSQPGKELLAALAGIHRERSMPTFASQTFRDWFRKRQAEQKPPRPQVALIVDLFTNYHEPGIGKSAVKVLEALGYQVLVPDVQDLGRPQISKGMLKHAKAQIEKNIPKLATYVNQEIPLIGLEPSEILTLRDEYLDLCSEQHLNTAEAIAKNAYQFEEFVLHHRDGKEWDPSLFDQHDSKVHLHGHCHAKALVGNTPTIEALKLAGYLPHDLETGCCGMAGSFGYEADHYGLSMDIGELILFPSAREIPDREFVCAPGFSCRHQIRDGTGRRSYHPAELMDMALPEDKLLSNK